MNIYVWLSVINTELFSFRAYLWKCMAPIMNEDAQRYSWICLFWRKSPGFGTVSSECVIIVIVPFSSALLCFGWNCPNHFTFTSSFKPHNNHSRHNVTTPILQIRKVRFRRVDGLLRVPLLESSRAREANVGRLAWEPMMFVSVLFFHPGSFWIVSLLDAVWLRPSLDS